MHIQSHVFYLLCVIIIIIININVQLGGLVAEMWSCCCVYWCKFILEECKFSIWIFPMRIDKFHRVKRAVNVCTCIRYALESFQLTDITNICTYSIHLVFIQSVNVYVHIPSRNKRLFPCPVRFAINQFNSIWNNLCNWIESNANVNICGGRKFVVMWLEVIAIFPSD